MELYAINTGNLKLDGGAMFGVVPKVMWNKLYPADENNQCNWSMRCLLAVDGDRKILIDCGIGNKQDEKFFANLYLNGDDNLHTSLAKAGYTTDDITDVVLTHLHFDHCGGAVQNKADKSGYDLTFKNATYWIGKAHWELANKPNAREKASFLKENFVPLMEAGKVKFIEVDTTLFPGFKVKIFNGHTVGQVIPHIEYKGRTVVYMADLMPASVHIPLAYIISYDTQPLVSLSEKESFLNEALANDYILFFEHDIYNECCDLQQTEKGIRPKNYFDLAVL
ncbi:MAG: MBL fold metallo-hydrolase [Bacteroidetes bacterium]|nr:MBL fold metallo-hydrolase [Bacteroidota bacterium]